MNLGDLVKMYGAPGGSEVQAAPGPKATSAPNSHHSQTQNNGAQRSQKPRGAAQQAPFPQQAYGYGYAMAPYGPYAGYSHYGMPQMQMMYPHQAYPTAQYWSNGPQQTQTQQATDSTTSTTSPPSTSNQSAEAPSEASQTAAQSPSDSTAATPSVGWAPAPIRPNFVPAAPLVAAGTVLYPGMPAYPPGFLPPQARPKQRSKPSKRTEEDRPTAEEGAESEDGAFTCEPCEKSFKQKKFFDAHLKQHLPCPYDGCKFSAVRGVLKMHEIIHMKNMMAKLETPEEIERYRQERRKRYPTAENVAKKIEEEELKRKERGDLFDLAPGKKKDRRNNSNINKNKNQTQNQRRQTQQAPSGQPGAPAEGAVADGAAVVDIDGNSDAANQSRKRSRAPCKFWKQGRCKKGDQCPFSHDESQQQHQDQDQMPLRKKRKLGGDEGDSGPSSIMSMFLHEEATKEHDAIMQCFRFIVANQFFQN